MADEIRERLRHALLALLLSAGLAVPLCGVLDSCLLSPRLFMIIAGTVLLFEVLSLHRAAAWTGTAAAVAAAAIWIFGGDGARTLSDVFLAVSLRLRGITAAVPLAALPVTLVTAVTVTLLSCFSALRSATCIPALMLCAAVMTAVWLSDSMALLPWLLPAIAAALTLLLVYRFDDVSVLRVLPWAAALTAAAFLLTGAAPRETPLKEKADEIRQAILDRLFFTEARDVFSLYSVGYSPQGADQLGGKPDPSDRPVMQVSTTRKTYLRGTVYNRYDGHGWQNTTGGRRFLWQSARMEERRSLLFDEALPSASIQNSLSESVPVSVRMISGSASTLFVPQRIRELVPGGEMVPYFSNSSEIFITRNLQAGDTYEATAPLYTSEDPGIGALTELCAMQEDTRWETIRNTYLELPSHLEQPVRDLALEVASAGEMPFEKAKAIQNYLTRNHKYTLDVGEHPENVDFVTSFLMDTRKGYCTYFASAMTVLCRLAGLPARYVEGYLAEPDGNGEALVTGLNAHAWTEVYFKGFGWLTFDATPGRSSTGGQGSSSSGARNTSEPSPEQTETPAPETEESIAPDKTVSGTPEPPETQTEQPHEAPSEEQQPPEDPEFRGENSAPSFLWWLLVAAVICAAAGLRMLFTSPLFREKRAGREEERFDIWTEEIAKLLRAEGFERENGETPLSFARRIDRSCRFSESVLPAGECLSAIRYSRARPLQSDTGLMRDTSLLIRGELSGRGRTRYLVRRMLPFSGRRRPGRKTEK